MMAVNYSIAIDRHIDRQRPRIEITIKAKKLNIKIIDRESFLNKAKLYEIDDGSKPFVKDPKYRHGDVLDFNHQVSPLTDTFFIYKKGNTAKLIKNHLSAFSFRRHAIRLSQKTGIKYTRQGHCE